MIRIAPQKIDHWEDIKEKHQKAVKEIIKKSIEKFKYKEGKYILKPKQNDSTKKTIEFNSKDKDFLEALLNITIDSTGADLKVTSKDADKTIFKFAVDNLDDIFSIYYKAIRKLSEFEDYTSDDMKLLFSLYVYIEDIKGLLKNDGLYGKSHETKSTRKKVLENYLNNNIDLNKYLDNNFLNQCNKTDFFGNKDTFNKAVKLNDVYESKIEKLEELNTVLKKIFNYDTFDSGVDISVQNTNSKEKLNINERWNRHKLISALNIRTCPYCNRQYITSYIDSSMDDKTTADLDHFYSQSRYPFLALSLYNFIPSCQICNSRFKLAKDFYLEKHLYPYEDSFANDAHFTIKENYSGATIDYLLGLSTDFEIDIKIDKNAQDTDKLKNSIETFRLKEVYQSHTDYVSELIKKSLIYNESKINELCSQYPELFMDKNDVIQLVFSNYISDDDLGKRPLAKLTKDICEELEIL